MQDSGNLVTWSTILFYIGWWYAIGFICVILMGVILIIDGKQEEIRIKDIEALFGWSLFGAINAIILSWMLMLKITSGFRSLYSDNRDMVLWRSKTSKAKAVLFGDKDNDDD